MAGRVIVRSPHLAGRIYKTAQAGIFLYPLLLPVMFIVFRDVQTTQRLIGVFATAFATLPVIAGFIGGLQYPLATFLLHRGILAGNRSAAGTAGMLYAVDVLGAAVGALVTGALLIPLYGINTVALLCAAINAAVFFLLYPAKLSPDV